MITIGDKILGMVFETLWWDAGGGVACSKISGISDIAASHIPIAKLLSCGLEL